MEKAFHRLAANRNGADMAVPAGWMLVKTYGIRPGMLAVTQVWQAPGEQDYIVAAKGAPESIQKLCGLAGQTNEVKAAIDAMAAGGQRVLGIACGRIQQQPLPDIPDAFALTFLGLTGLADPLRPSVPAAIAECRSAGIRVDMITGDHPATAAAIAAEAGLDARRVLTGEALLQLSDSELAKQVRITSVFARIMPEQKLRIVNALKASGEIVAMTGDGVNDAPSLKSAHIGIAMGKKGSEIAKEVSSLIITDDDLSRMVDAIAMGRKIYSNLKKAIQYIISIHI